MSEKWKCPNCGTINPPNKMQCLVCNNPKGLTNDDIIKIVEEKTQEIQNTLERLIKSTEPISQKWEYGAITYTYETEVQQGILPFTSKKTETAGASFFAFGKEKVEFTVHQVPEVIAMLGDNGWELADTTESIIASGLAGYVALSTTLYFKRTKE